MAITIDGTTGIEGTGTNGELLKVKGAGSEAHLYIDNNEFSVRVDPDNDESSSILTLDIDGSEKIRVDSGGDVTVKTGDLVFGTAGKGICLGVTSNTDSNTLDDYEEGTFTPTMSAGYTSPGYHSDTNGWYTKTGNTVYARVYMRLNAGTPNSDQVTIAGLPFTHAGAFYAAAQGYIPTGDVGAAVHPLLVLMPSTTNFKLYVQNQTSVGTRSGSSLNANCELIYWITYKVA